MNQDNIIHLASDHIGMSLISLYGPPGIIQLIQNHPEITKLYEERCLCKGEQVRGVDELKQLLQSLDQPKRLLTGDEFHSLLMQKEPKPARKQEPYYRRFQKRKF